VISKTFSIEVNPPAGAAVRTLWGFIVDVEFVLALAADVRGTRVMANVPTNKSANTTTPKIHFQKFGLLVIGSSPSLC